MIRSADAALWVSGARPKGKGFDLALDARQDTSRWLEITGVVREGRGLQWLEAVSEGIQLGKAPTTSAPVEEPTPVRASGRSGAGGRLQRADAGRNRCRAAHFDPHPVLARHQGLDAEGEYSGRLSRVGDRRARRAHHAHRGLHDAVQRREPGTRSEVRQAARALPDAAGRAEGRDPRNRRPAAQALDAHVRAWRVIAPPKPAGRHCAASTGSPFELKAAASDAASSTHVP